MKVVDSCFLIGYMAQFPGEKSMLGTVDLVKDYWLWGFQAPEVNLLYGYSIQLLST